MAQMQGGSYGIYRFRGQARVKREVLTWSLILKAMGPEVLAASGVATADPSDADYWKREILIFQSGLLADLPEGLVAVRCFGVFEYPGQEFWLWLEDVEDTVWSWEDYGLAARHVGQFNGAYLSGRPVPQATWLSTGRVRRWLAQGEAGIADIQRLSRYPFNRSWLGSDGVTRILHLWTEQARLLAALDRLPRTFCHHDAFRRNLMIRRNGAGQAETVAIDWAKAGTGAIGEEMATLVTMSVVFLELEADQLQELEAIVLTGYLAGLREAGWQGDPQLVRFGYAATAAISFGLGLAGIILTRFTTVEWIPTLEEIAGRPIVIDALLSERAIMQRHLLDLGDEALALLDGGLAL
jgi:hypothetical protein